MKSPATLKGRSLLTLDDLSDEEMSQLIDFASELKTRKADGVRGSLLERKNIAMIFEKSSTRTRCAVAVAAADEGGRAEHLSAQDIHLGKKESTADTARVLGKMFDGILFRGFKQKTVELLAMHSGIPVWNGLTDESHPTQAIADLMTVKEKFNRLSGLKLVYIGDGRNNVANSLMMGCAKCGVSFVNCTPPTLSPNSELVANATAVAQRNGATVAVTDDPGNAVVDANVIYTDVWVSMGEEDQREERIRLLRPYQVNMDLMTQTGNLDSGSVIFLHCLPAFHDSNTDITAKSGALEVTDDVFEHECSHVFAEAENRMHTTKALLIASMVGEA
ncbi:MAG: ornithine carbamoyltransferase [Kiritimatiellia bacterium]|jgi:ornithine carbamoyltransferase|nr:ornithine carbamoyltransferase [Kiritimatiellia bacterium]MDP6847223.1 ornithine carbamoyltransferase [Kiritimatiellia bacterium]